MEPGEVEMHWLRGGYAGLACPNEDECNVAMAIAARLYKQALTSVAAAMPVVRALAQLRADNPSAVVWSRLSTERAKCCSARAKAVAGFPHAPCGLGDRNLLLIGDAAGYGEPFVGDGITLAMLSGELAVRAVCESSGAPDAEMLVARYTGLMRRFHRPLMLRAQVLGRFLRQGWLDALDARLPRWWPTAPFVWLIGRMHARADNRLQRSTPSAAMGDMCA
jgi:hypothetical protein